MIITKKLFNILQDSELAPGRLHSLRSEGLITWKWKPFARVHADPSGSFSVHWNPAALAKHPDFKREEAVEALEEMHDGSGSGGTSDDVEWCL